MAKKTGQDPAFLFYASDFLVGTMTMSDAQVGKYIRLLCYQKVKNGRISEEDMLKICGTYDKDIFDKFTKSDEGFFYNERMKKEIDLRANFCNSRRNNRLSTKEADTSSTSVQHMSNTSATYVEQAETYVRHMENENTNTNNKSNSNNTNKNTNISSGEQVFDISSTHVEHMSLSEKKEQLQEIYKISTGNQHLEFSVEVCLYNYLNNNSFSKIRELHIIRLALDPNPQVAENILRKWGEAFNRGLRNDGIFKKQFAGGRESWVSHLPNWINRVKGARKGINPEILFTANDTVNQKLTDDKSSKKTPHILPPDASVEEQEEHYRIKPRE